MKKHMIDLDSDQNQKSNDKNNELRTRKPSYL